MKLKPCPFCGGEATTSHGVDDYTSEQFFFVSCEYCGSRTRKFYRYRCGKGYERKAIEAWNRREPIDKIVEQLEETKDEFSGGTLQEHYYWKGIEDAIEIVKGGAV